MGENHRFLHGTLELTIFNATFPSPSHCFDCLHGGKPKPAFVTIKIGRTRVAATRHERNRTWNQTFRILCSHYADVIITLSLLTSLSALGKVKIPAISLLSKGSDALASRSLFVNKGRSKTKIQLLFRLRFSHAESEFGWGKGFRGFKGLVHGAMFAQRSNCGVVLYQDAHHGCNFLPPVLKSGKLYRPRRLWEDMYKAIDGAKIFIYIAGWSFNPTLVLVRDPETDIPNAHGVELGTLLKKKAEEGVAVRILIWDDETSSHFIKNQGIMRTHDEEAFDYFKHTKVVCKPCPRLHHNFPTLFTHHQKTISLDARIDLFGDIQRNQEDGKCGEIISFIGGFDLCGGRYDTEKHPLFGTLNSESHVHDFYQINFAGASLRKGGPREPWHDAHAMLTGDAARDVLTNFEQRWAKQCNETLVAPNVGHDHHRHHHENWNVQVFRSIDHVSVTTLPTTNLSCECSIHDAYVQAIRRAERFIYIENQYFIGGCHLWDEDQNSGCTNLIPIEIGLKVASKIREKERFAVYIVIPMWPEGVPECESVQSILHWTRLTMATMYKLIGQAIAESGASSHPSDYLNFFCLANREEKGAAEYTPPSLPPCSTNYWKAQTKRRFMIYVHSKIMIVDDEYILIGSANINQRSMDGERDTEIAIGCYQPTCISNERSHREGEIQRYRMSLWYEHTARTENLFLKPEGLDCVKSWRRIGREMWEVYIGETVMDMHGVHVVSYPITVCEDGRIEDSVGVFPDTNALIRGKRSKFLPPLCTT